MQNTVLHDDGGRHADPPYLYGMTSHWRPLNGGSDTRRDVRLFAGQQACKSGEIIEANGHTIMRQMGPRRRRGRRHVSWTARAVSHPSFRWLHWRKAKRLLRKGVVETTAAWYERSLLA